MATPPDYAQTVKPDECALITERFARRLAYPLARLALRLGWSANAVTLLAGGCWLASLPLVVAAGALLGRERPLAGWTLWLLSGTLWNAGYLLDLADGSLARLTGTARPSGFFLDYVFHLLFKPAFLAAVGIALHLAWHGALPFLLLAVLAIPANWSASASAAEHVLCEETGKDRTGAAAEPDPAARRRLWLGATDSHAPAADKRRGLPRTLRVLAQEILSYYGQFSFFSALAVADLALAAAGLRPRLPLTATAFVLLGVFLALRVPFRVARDFRRIRDGMDPGMES